MPLADTQSSEKSPQPYFCFLSLPTEIRIEIYECVLGVVTATRFKITIDTDQYASSDTGRLILRCAKRPELHPDLAILRVNRQTYEEALPLLYGRCAFYPLADAAILASFFGHMSDFARSKIFMLHLRPRKQRIIRLAGPRATLSQVKRGPSWAPACEQISVLFTGLKELLIRLEPVHGHELERGDQLDWIIRPLSQLRGVKKTLVPVGSASGNRTPDMVVTWNELVKKADGEIEEYSASRERIIQHKEGWPNSYWMAKRSRLLSF